MSCLAAPTLPTTLPFGVTLGVPKAGIGIDLSVDFCCQFNIPISVSTDDLLAILGLAGISVATLSISADILAPISAQLILVNKYLSKLQLNCPLNGGGAA